MTSEELGVKSGLLLFFVLIIGFFVYAMLPGGDDRSPSNLERWSRVDVLIRGEVKGDGRLGPDVRAVLDVVGQPDKITPSGRYPGSREFWWGSSHGLLVN